MACTGQSRWRALRRWRPAWPALLIAFALLGSAGAATNERVVADRHSGLALWGYDPVAYHMEGAARQGSDKYELAYANVVWRFVNAGNLAAFKEAPDDYMPAFGGHDPSAVARKAAVPGNPEVFAVWSGRLLLFRNEASRERFFTDPATAFRAAESGWDEASKTLPR